jgi:hypothetical protein
VQGAVLALASAMLAPAAASGAAPARHLGVAEARTQVRDFLEGIEQESGDDMSARRVWGCRRGSVTRVACRFYEAGLDAQDEHPYHCWGKIRVVEYPRRYAHMGYAITCRNGR